MNNNLSKQTGETDWLPIMLALGAVLGGAAIALLSLTAIEPLFLFVGFAALVGAYIIFRFPQWGLIGLVVIVYANLSDVLKQSYGVPSLAQPYISLLCAVVLARWAIFGEQPKGWKLAGLLIGIYGFITFLSLFYAQNFNRAYNAVDDYVKVSIICLLITILLRRGETFRRVFWTLIAIGAFLGTINVFQSVTGTFDNTYFGFARPPVVDMSGSEDTARTAGPIGDPNFFAQIMVMVLPLALDRFWYARSTLARLAAGYATLVIAMTVFITFSRGAFLAMVIAFCAMFVGRKISPAALLLTPLVLIALLQLAPANYTERLLTLTDFLPGQAEEGTTNESFRGRQSEMLAAVMMFQDYPLLGVGVGNYNTRYLEYSRVIGMDGRAENRSAHSLYLEIAAERGLFGLSAFFLLVGVMFYNLYKSSRDLYQQGLGEMGGMIKSLAVALVTYLFASIFLHDSFPRYFWLLTGICMALPYVARQEIARHRRMAAEPAPAPAWQAAPAPAAAGD